MQKQQGSEILNAANSCNNQGGDDLSDTFISSHSNPRVIAGMTAEYYQGLYRAFCTRCTEIPKKLVALANLERWGKRTENNSFTENR